MGFRFVDLSYVIKAQSVDWRSSVISPPALTPTVPSVPGLRDIHCFGGSDIWDKACLDPGFALLQNPYILRGSKYCIDRPKYILRKSVNALRPIFCSTQIQSCDFPAFVLLGSEEHQCDMALLFLLAKQLFSKPPYPETDFTGKTVVVTGSNTGLGKEAVRHFARLNAKEVIIAVRSVPKGEQARKEIEADLNPEGTISVWELDYGNYDSVKAFAKRAAELDRIDAVVLNAAVAGAPFQRFEGEESQIVVNVISTMLLAVLLVPILRQVASRHHIVPTISITSSEVHAFATGFPERNAENIFMALNDEKKSNMMLR